MSNTYTRSVTDTYTEARARYVMGKAYDDILNLVWRGLITRDYADSIRRDILYLLSKKVLKSFELQFTTATGREIGGIHYEVKSDSTISMDNDSGGIDFWGLDDGTEVSLFIVKDNTSPHIEEVNRQLQAWGWGTGNALTGSKEYSKSYSKDGFGLKQSIIGKW